MNITAFFLPRHLEPLVYGWSWQHPLTGRYPFRDPKNIVYHDKQGHIYSLRSIPATGVCQPVMKPCDNNEQDDGACAIQIYSWGFSYQQAFISSILILSWTIGLFLMWLTASLQLPLNDTPEIPRGWRAVIYLGETLRKDLEQHGIDAEKLTDRELRRQVNKVLSGVKVRFKEQLTHPGRGFRTAFKQWLARSKAAFAFLSMLSIFTAFIMPWCLWQHTVYTALLLGLGFGSLWATVFGYNPESRLLLVAAAIAGSVLICIPQFLKS